MLVHLVFKCHTGIDVRLWSSFTRPMRMFHYSRIKAIFAHIRDERTGDDDGDNRDGPKCNRITNVNVANWQVRQLIENLLRCLSKPISKGALFRHIEQMLLVAEVHFQCEHHSRLLFKSALFVLEAVPIINFTFGKL